MAWRYGMLFNQCLRLLCHRFLSCVTWGYIYFSPVDSCDLWGCHPGGFPLHNGGNYERLRMFGIKGGKRSGLTDKITARFSVPVILMHSLKYLLLFLVI